MVALTIPEMWAKMIQHFPRHPDSSGFRSWACGAAGSALPWHGRGRRFDPDQVHHIFNYLQIPRFSVW